MAPDKVRPGQRMPLERLDHLLVLQLASGRVENLGGKLKNLHHILSSGEPELVFAPLDGTDWDAALFAVESWKRPSGQRLSDDPVLFQEESPHYEPPETSALWVGWRGVSPVIPASVPLTIMFTDILESTRLISELGDHEWMSLLDSHDGVLAEEVDRWGGRVVKHVGDGIMASFPSPSDAIKCAVRVQRTLSTEDPRMIRIRVGLCAGEVLRRGEDLFGAVVNLSARICEAAEPDQILVAGVVRELCRGSKILFGPTREIRARGFEENLLTYRVEWDAPRPADAVL